MSMTTDDNEEQVLGVLRRCDVCDEKTLHVDGVCQDHKIVRRRKRATKTPMTPSGMSRREKVAAERAADAKSGGGLRRLITLLVFGGLIWLMGATHVLHGDRTGVAFCWKEGWRLGDTFVNTDEIAKTNKRVLDALARCEY